MKHLVRALALSAAVWATVSPATAHAIAFDPFVKATDITGSGIYGGNSSVIGFSYAGNKFVGSIYFNNQLYSTNLSGTGVQAFGAPLPITSGSAGEIYVSSSLGLNGWGSRDIFAGSESFGTVWKYANNASNATAAIPFVTGLSTAGVRSIAFDPYGNYNYDMIVATQDGRIYRVDNTGVANEIANLGVDTEGLDFAPPGGFGNIPGGTLVVLSEGSGKINAISPTGQVTDIGLQFSTPEMISFVPTDFTQTLDPLAGFYAAGYPVEVYKADRAEFAPYAGQAIVTEENSHQVYAVSWDGSKFVKTNIGQFPQQPEDGIFVTAAILDPGCTTRPEGCNNDGGGDLPEPGTFALLGGLLIGGLGMRWRQKAK